MIKTPSFKGEKEEKMGGNGRRVMKSEGGSWEENVCGVLQNEVGEINFVSVLFEA